MAGSPRAMPRRSPGPQGPRRARHGPPARMRAIVQDVYGLPDVLELHDVDIPTPDDDQVLIKVVASSLNIYDWHMTTGTPYDMARAVAGLTKPKHPVPGADVAGVVVSVGKDVSDIAVGDEVFGDIGYGAFAEYARRRSQVDRSQAGKRHVRASRRRTAGGADRTPGPAATSAVSSRATGCWSTVLPAASAPTPCRSPRRSGQGHRRVQHRQGRDRHGTLGADNVIDYTKDDYVVTEQAYDIRVRQRGEPAVVADEPGP